MNNVIIIKPIIKYSNADNGILKCSTNISTCNNNVSKCIRVDSIIIKINIPYSTPFTNNIPPDNDVNMVNKTLKINHIQFADDIESTILIIHAPTNAIKNTTPRVNTVHDQHFEPFKAAPPIVTTVNDKPVDAFVNDYNEIVADGANTVDQIKSINHSNGNVHHNPNGRPINVAASGYVDDVVFADEIDDIDMSDITTNTFNDLKVQWLDAI